jgi:DsbC/DsbD-like thiol-disulfide interchange protein
LPTEIEILKATSAMEARPMDMTFSWRMATPFILLCITFAIAPLAHSQAAESHANLELVAERSAPASGEPLWVGLLFRLDPGWHIYWQNPGDSGEPPKVQWHLPKGFRAAGYFDWPTPIRLGSGSVVDYGYEGKVFLMSPITVPTGAKASAIAAIAAEVKYVVCSEICIPGKAHVTLSIPSSGETAAQTIDSHELFQQTRGQLPWPGPPGWRTSVVSDKDHFIVSVRGVPPPRRVTFFPLRPGVIENSAPQVLDSAEDGFRLTLKKSDQYTSYPLLRGILVLDSSRGVQISAMILASAAQR